MPADGDGSYRRSVLYDTIGEAYLLIIFAAAAAADPDAKLYYEIYVVLTSLSGKIWPTKLVTSNIAMVSICARPNAPNHAVSAH